MNILTNMNKEKKKQKEKGLDPRITLRVILGSTLSTNYNYLL